MDISNESLVSDIQAGINKKENMEKLWNSNKGLVGNILKKYKGVADLEDLRQECYIAMSKAVETFDVIYGRSFAGWFMDIAPHHLSDYINNNCKTIRLPANTRIDLWNYKKIVDHYRKTEDREPTDVELLVELDCNMDKLDRLNYAKTVKCNASLDVPLKNSEDDSLTLEDTVIDKTDNYHDVMKNYDYKIMTTDLHDALERLPEAQRTAIYERYFNGQTLQEVGEKMGVSRERARQHIMAGFRLIIIRDSKKHLRSYYDNYLNNTPIRSVSWCRFSRTHTSEQERYVLEKERRRKEVLAKQIKKQKRIDAWNARQEMLWKTNPAQAEAEWKREMDRIFNKFDNE